MGAEAAAGYAGIIGGTAAHLQGMAGEVSPSATAQRQEFKKARDRLKIGQYGFSSAQQQSAQAMGNQMLQAQAGQQQDAIARASAGGQLAGGAATEAQRAVAQEQAVGAAQIAEGVQAASNAAAQANHSRDQGIVDNQADRARAFWREQGAISMQTTQGANIGEGSQAMADSLRKRKAPVGENPAPTTTYEVVR
jgi:hypothetical protein